MQAVDSERSGEVTGLEKEGFEKSRTLARLKVWFLLLNSSNIIPFHCVSYEEVKGLLWESLAPP